MKTTLVLACLVSCLAPSPSAFADSQQCDVWEQRLDQADVDFRKQNATEVEKCDASRQGACKDLWKKYEAIMDKIADDACSAGCNTYCP